KAVAQILLLACALSVGCAHDFSSYPFKATLNTAENGGLYELYWKFDNAKETISFAVRVNATGWVGLGLSPNGQMPNSDVVIGWVTDGGETVFHDRFAGGREPPTIDEQQDWMLKGGEEENGFTILEFSRKYVTCDEYDLPITTETARVIWSFHATTDPTSEVLTFADRHSHKGALSLNLLGGLPDAAPDPQDLEYYDVTVDEIIIPENDTTYWCAAFRLPEDIRTQKKYITKFSPRVTKGNDAHVHHLLVYLCDSLNETHVGNGGSCRDGVANEVVECRSGVLIAAWAVGGETFVYPNNVAFPFGGEDFPEYVVMELHYDNPELKQGTVDSSGMRLWYTSTPREHEAGVLQVGHFVTEYHIIPPNSENFTTTGIVFDDCTNEFFPQEGIHVFANALHTHEVGHGLNLQHIRYNSECDVYEELEPIDKNLKYDFDFQQINHLKREVVIMPGDILQLKCFYGTKGFDKVTLGGLSTRDEMCLSFLFYYPKLEISIALSQIAENELRTYFSKLPPETAVNFRNGLNSVTWDEAAMNDLQRFANESEQFAYCGNLQDRGVVKSSKFPNIGCPYIPPDQCSATPNPPTCCERISATEDGVVLRASVALLLLLSLLAATLG
ncbi:DBH-like monooxygenase protein 1 homolog, partial [Geodia barretti]